MVKYISAVLRFHGILSCCIHRSVFNIGLFLTTNAVIGIHRVIFVMEIRTSSIDECNFRICTAVSVFWLNSMRYCGFCTFFCAVLRLSDPLYAPLLFGEPYDEKKYTKVIQACALTDDINRFPNGDLAFVGEYGVVLSGGQRARVNLARAVYADADVYLLDDPLSAVDSKVGDHIFSQCICDLLYDKIKVLVTYSEKHMKEADQILVLHSGSVLGKGTFSELRKSGKIIDTIIDPSISVKKKTSTQNELDHLRFIAIEDSFNEHLEVSEEDKATGKISSLLYWDYFRAGMHPVCMALLFLLFLVTQGKSIIP